MHRGGRASLGGSDVESKGSRAPREEGQGILRRGGMSAAVDLLGREASGRMGLQGTQENGGT